jgi:hypothetical protein
MTMAMKKGLKARWVAALRSGNYKQGRYTLHTEKNNGEIVFCCLGVLVDISPAVASRNTCTSQLDESTLDYAGISVDEMNKLTNLNDHREFYGFRRIANYIEKNL